MRKDVELLIQALDKGSDERVYKASDSLAEIGSDEVMNSMIQLFTHENSDTRFLAARTLGLMKENQEALDPLMNAIQHKDNSTIAGDLLMALEGFDVSKSYIDLFKLYLFGSYKVSRTAKELLDYKEFDITPRVLKKANKHWNHYVNNVKHNDAFELRRIEVEEMFDDLKEFLGN